MKKIFFFFFSLVILLFGVSPVKAITIAPTKSLITIDRQTSQSISVDVFNETDENLNLTTQILGMTQNQDGGPLFDTDISLAEKWVSSDVNNFELGFGESKKINFIVSVPDDVYPSSYYVGLAVKSVNDKGEGTGVSSQLVSLLTIQVAGLATENINITNWRTDSFIWGEKKINFNLKFKNLGNVEVPLLGTLETKSFWGRKIFTNEIYLGNQLLVNAVRNLDSKINFADDKFLWPGVYQAVAVINYGKTNQLITSETNFLYLPTWSLVVFGLLIFTIILGIFKIKKRK